jgi:hypothetical protein
MKKQQQQPRRPKTKYDIADQLYKRFGNAQAALVALDTGRVRHIVSDDDYEGVKDVLMRAMIMEGGVR